MKSKNIFKKNKKNENRGKRKNKYNPKNSLGL